MASSPSPGSQYEAFKKVSKSVIHHLKDGSAGGGGSIVAKDLRSVVKSIVDRCDGETNRQIEALGPLENPLSVEIMTFMTNVSACQKSDSQC